MALVALTAAVPAARTPTPSLTLGMNAIGIAFAANERRLLVTAHNDGTLWILQNPAG
jgi:hypothetical protein